MPPTICRSAGSPRSTSIRISFFDLRDALGGFDLPHNEFDAGELLDADLLGLHRLRRGSGVGAEMEAPVSARAGAGVGALASAGAGARCLGWLVSSTFCLPEERLHVGAREQRALPASGLPGRETTPRERLLIEPLLGNAELRQKAPRHRRHHRRHHHAGQPQRLEAVVEDAVQPRRRRALSLGVPTGPAR